MVAPATCDASRLLQRGLSTCTLRSRLLLLCIVRRWGVACTCAPPLTRCAAMDGASGSRTPRSLTGEEANAMGARATAATGEEDEVVADGSDDESTTCVVCLDAHPTVLLMVFGHVVLCANCMDALRQRHGNTGKCPMCRASLQGEALLSAFGDSDGAVRQFAKRSLIPADVRMDSILVSINGVFADDGLEAAASAEEDRNACSLFRSAFVADCFTLLSKFADHTLEQRRLALTAGALDTVANVMRKLPFDLRVQSTGVAAAGVVGCLESMPKDLLRAAWQQSGALSAVLHALRFCAGTAAPRAVAVAAECMTQALRALPCRALPLFDAVALTRLACRVFGTNMGVDVVQPAMEDLLGRLSCSYDACALICVTEALRMLPGARPHRVATNAVIMLHAALGAHKRPHTTVCAAALDGDALRVLLTLMAEICSCGCKNCIAVIGRWLLPSLTTLCASSPAALQAALERGIMPVLSEMVGLIVRKPWLSLPLCVFITRCLPLEVADDDAAWSSARQQLAHTMTGAELLGRTALLAQEDTRLVERYTAQVLERGGTLVILHKLTHRAAMSLRAFTGLLHHGLTGWLPDFAVKMEVDCCAELAETHAHVFARTPAHARSCVMRSAAQMASMYALGALVGLYHEYIAREALDACARVVTAVLKPAYTCGCAVCDETEHTACLLLLKTFLPVCGKRRPRRRAAAHGRRHRCESAARCALGGAAGAVRDAARQAAAAC